MEFFNVTARKNKIFLIETSVKEVFIRFSVASSWNC